MSERLKIFGQAAVERLDAERQLAEAKRIEDLQALLIQLYHHHRARTKDLAREGKTSAALHHGLIYEQLADFLGFSK